MLISFSARRQDFSLTLTCCGYSLNLDTRLDPGVLEALTTFAAFPPFNLWSVVSSALGTLGNSKASTQILGVLSDSLLYLSVDSDRYYKIPVPSLSSFTLPGSPLEEFSRNPGTFSIHPGYCGLTSPGPWPDDPDSGSVAWIFGQASPEPVPDFGAPGWRDCADKWGVRVLEQDPDYIPSILEAQFF